jgi:hypothetical protein
MTTRTTETSVERLYRGRRTPELVEVPPLRYLCLDGHGDPNTSPAYADAVQALYSVSYAAKFALRKDGADFKVSPLEGFWSAEDMSTFVTGDKGAWDWTMVIRQPDSVTDDRVARLVAEVAEKKGLPAVRDLRVETITEGTAAQVLHVGPYAAEGPTVQRLHDFIHEQGFVFSGDVERHHEIYLGDPRRAAPEKLRTIVRQACRRP